MKIVKRQTTKQIQYVFYKKPMASKFTICKSSSLSQSIKSSTITQEFITRLSNTSVDNSQEVINKILEDYIATLYRSGYIRTEIRKCWFGVGMS